MTAQSPAPGAVVALGALVTITTGIGPLHSPWPCDADAELPDVAGLRLTAAAAALQRAGRMWTVPSAPRLPPALGLRRLFDGYVVAATRTGAGDACFPTLHVALAAAR